MTERPDQFALADLLDMTTEQTGHGTARSRVSVGSAHLNPHGSVHGAVLFAIVDTAMGGATMSVVGEGQLCASIDVQVRFCRPVFDGDLVATAEVRHAGKRVVHLQAEVHDHDDTLVAIASGSFAVLGQPAPATG